MTLLGMTTVQIGWDTSEDETNRPLPITIIASDDDPAPDTDDPSDEPKVDDADGKEDNVPVAEPPVVPDPDPEPEPEPEPVEVDEFNEDDFDDDFDDDFEEEIEDEEFKDEDEFDLGIDIS
jgi:hypothetical protein